MLNLPEKLLLLALDDEKGNVLISSSVGLRYGLAGAVLLELWRLDRIAFEGKAVTVREAISTVDPILDEALTVMAGGRKPRDTKHWVRTLGNKFGEKWKNRLLARLLNRNILRQEENRFLWVIPYTRYPTRNPGPELELRYAIRTAVQGNTRPDDATVALLGLVKACGLIGEVVPRAERKAAERRIEELMADGPVAGEVAAVIREVTVALMVVVTSAAVSS